MGVSDKLAGVVDSYYKVFNPKEYHIRRLQRELSQKMGYRNATKSRINSSIRRGNYSADDHMSEVNLDTLRDTSRGLDRDNMFAKAILDRLEEAVVGNGIDFRVQSQNKAWNRKAERMLKSWWNDTPEVRGLLSGPDLERMAMRSAHVDGDILFALLDKRGQIQAIEGDRIRNPHNKADNVVNGVELDALGMPTRFYVHPHEDRRANRRGKKPEPTIIESDNAVFYALRHRFSQTRGVPAFTPNMELFEDIDAFTEASIIQQKMSAAHVMFIERNGGLAGLDNVTTEEDSFGNQDQVQTFKPGTVLYGEKGESAKMLGASQTGQQFAPFVTQMQRFAGLDFGLPLEILALDFSKTNYSSARASLLTAHKCFKKKHEQLVRSFLKPIFTWKINQWIKSGRLEERDDFDIAASPPKMISLDPAKETKADVERINAGLTSNREVCNTNGTSWKDSLDYRAEEIEYAAKIAKNVVKRTDEQWSARDILGLSQKYNESIFREEDESEDTDNTE